MTTTTTTTTDLTDRDRLVLALDELRSVHGYWTPNPSDLQPGPTLAAHEVPGGTPYVTWHAQVDDVAFGYGWSAIDTCATCAEHADRLSILCDDTDHLDDEILEAWAGDTDDQLDLDEKVHIAEAHQTIVYHMSLQWAGDAALICNVLRHHGLDAREPADRDTCIAVLPADPKLWPHWATCDHDRRCFAGHHHRYKPLETERGEEQS